MRTKRWNKISKWLIIIELVAAFTVILIGQKTFANKYQKNNSYEVKNSNVSKKDHKTMEKFEQEKTTVSNDIKAEKTANIQDQQQNPAVTTSPANTPSAAQNTVKSIVKTWPKDTTQKTAGSMQASTKPTKAPTTNVSAPNSSTPATTKPTALPTTATEPTSAGTTNTPTTNNQEPTATSGTTTQTESTASSDPAPSNEQSSQAVDSTTISENPVLNK